MKIAIMQPYWLPYLGYYQLINEADLFLIYNDVNFIERGWINKNRFLINKEPKSLSIPLKKASYKKRINEIEVAFSEKTVKKLKRTIEQSYSKATFFEKGMEIFDESLPKIADESLDELCMRSMNSVCNYLGIDTEIKLSSNIDYNRSLDKVEKVKVLATQFDADTIVFPSGSKEIYSQSNFVDFESYTIDTYFLEYDQGLRSFFPGLSILDMIMHLEPSQVKKHLKNFNKHKLG